MTRISWSRKLRKGGDGEPPDLSGMFPGEAPMNENEREPSGPFSRIGQRGRERNPDRERHRFQELGRTATGSHLADPGRGSEPDQAGQLGATKSGWRPGSGAREMINRLLTTPRAPGTPIGGAQGAAATPQVFERGIAGVASQAEGSGVKVYNGREAPTSNGEFVYDYRKDRGGLGGTGDARPDGRSGPAGARPESNQLADGGPAR